MVIPKRHRFAGNWVEMFPRCFISMGELNLENEHPSREDRAVVSIKSTSKAA